MLKLLCVTHVNDIWIPPINSIVSDVVIQGDMILRNAVHLRYDCQCIVYRYVVRGFRRHIYLSLHGVEVSRIGTVTIMHAPVC